MDGFTTGVDQFLVILQLLIRETQIALPLARQKATPPLINLGKSQRNTKTDIFWKHSMPRQDYNQHKAESQEQA